MTKYTDDKNILMLISILKSNNIRKVIASPGTQNIGFVASIQSDPFFEIYSCVDERSACYMACGLAVESGEPVIITCTGATASRNYMSGLTEAFYRKIPILAITCDSHFSKIGTNTPQIIDRSKQLNDTFKISVNIPSINDEEDYKGCNLLINKAILELKNNGGGPVNINIVTTNNGRISFNTNKLPCERIIQKYTYEDNMPNILSKKVGIYVGNHKKWTEELTKQVDDFCEKFNSIVICDHTSNYNGKYKIMGNLLFDQELSMTDINQFDLLIYIGDVSGAYMNIKTKEVWRVNCDGEIRDVFFKTTKVFQMSELYFFKNYNLSFDGDNNVSLYTSYKKELDSLIDKKNSVELPLSNLYVARELVNYIPENSCIHLAILNSLRSWNYNPTCKKLNFYSNTGGFGIDGGLSTFIGASLFDKTKDYYCVIGDLAFFYDMNCLGNRHINNNLKIILINNGCGTEFHNYSHVASKLDLDEGKYVAADGHFGNKSNTIVKNYVESLGFNYLSVHSIEEFADNIKKFIDSDKATLIEVFTNSTDESQALKIVRTLKKDSKGKLKEMVRNNVSTNTYSKIKKIIKG